MIITILFFVDLSAVVLRYIRNKDSIYMRQPKRAFVLSHHSITIPNLLAIQDECTASNFFI